MSLILEALKKSETRRRLGEAPDIGTPFTVKPRRRNPWPLIVIVIAVAAGIGWWYARTMPRPVDANTVVSLPAPPARPAIGKSPADARQTATPVAKAGPAPAARESASAPAQPKPDGSVAGRTAKPPARADGGAAGVTAPGGVDAQAMRPVNRQLPLPGTPAPTPATANPNTPTVPAPAAQPPISRAPRPPVPVAAAPARPSAEPAVAPPPQQANAAPVQPDAAPSRPADAPPPVAAAPAVPQYYELAYAVRKDIPQFNLSMHVFAPGAGARFIVVDGERKVEGDALKEGLVLREVRSDGIILEFRGQRFFYPRPGH
jgi:general secretion pathway protein B